MIRVPRILVLAVLLVAATPWWASAQTFVFGGPGSLEGKFEDADGNFDPQGWLDVECTPDDFYWQVDTYQAENLNSHGVGNHALWCGQSAAQQPTWTDAPGYGNDWLAVAEWRGVVPNPAAAVTVGLDFYYNHDTEFDYDFFMVDWYDGTHWQNLLNVSGTNKNAGIFEPPGQHFVQTWVVQPSEFTGPNQDEVRIRLFVTSDGGISDQDDLLGFDFDGAAQVDDILVTFDAQPVDGGGDADGLATFEEGDDEGWTPVGSPCSCAILSMLSAQYDPSMSNPTPVLARVLDTSLRIAQSCFFTSPEFDWTTAEPLDGAFLQFDSFFWSTGRLGFTDYRVDMVWRVDGVWQPIETVFVGEVPLASWQRIYVDLTGIAPPSAETAAMGFITGFGDGLLDVIAFDNVTAGRFDTAVAAPPAQAAAAWLSVHPNPANPRATVRFQMDHTGPAKVTLYDLRGRKVRTLVDGVIDAGVQEQTFDGLDDSGAAVASGIYIVRFETVTDIFARRLTLVK